MSSTFNKIVLFGEKGSGKKTIYARYKGVEPGPNLGKGAGFYNKLVRSGDAKVSLCLWYPDHHFYAVGQFPKMYFKDVFAIIMLYEISNRQSYENL